MNKVKLHIKTIILIITLVILIFTLCINYFYKSQHVGSNIIAMDSVDEIINTKTLSHLLNNYSDLQHVILLSRDSCKNCVEAKQKIDNVFSNLSDDEYYISYFDTDNNREDEEFKVLLDGLGIKTVPTIIVINHKKNKFKIIDSFEILMDIDRLVGEIKS